MRYFLITASALLLTACAGNPNYPGCDSLREQQATRQACLDAAPGCALTAEDMKKHRQTADSIARYCTRPSTSAQ